MEYFLPVQFVWWKNIEYCVQITEPPNCTSSQFSLESNPAIITYSLNSSYSFLFGENSILFTHKHFNIWIYFFFFVCLLFFWVFQYFMLFLFFYIHAFMLFARQIIALFTIYLKKENNEVSNSKKYIV